MRKECDAAISSFNNKRATFLALIAAFVVIFSAHALTVAQARITKSFDKDWLFYKGDASGAENETFDDSAWRKLHIPHDWSIEGPFSKDNPTGGAGGFLPAGIGWYRKHFIVPADYKDRRVTIEFDGVMANSDVWVNGFHLGKRPYGYVSFAYDLTGHLNFGKDNVMAVRADNSQQPASRWYTGAGIYRHVRLVATDPDHFTQWGVFVTTPQVSAKQATVHVSGEITNQSSAAQMLAMQIDLLDPNGKVVASGESKGQAVEPNQISNFGLDLSVRNPQLWDIGKGILYKAVARVRAGSKTLDDLTVPFGIREFHFDPATGFWMNGRNFKIKGMCLHHDGSAFGAAVPLAVWERRLTELRKLGVNAIRNAHNPAGDFLDLADKMGFIVMDELFDQWTLAKNPYDYHLYFNEWSKIDVRDTVRRDRNHPSVFIYSAGNEIRDNHADPEKAKQTLRGLVDTFHENDPTRPVTQALFRPNTEGANDYNNGLADILDVIGQNYREKEILAAWKQKPTRKIIGTENDRSSLDQWLAMRDHPEYSGQFIWAGVDYLGEARVWPNYGFSYGMLDRTAYKRPLGWQRQSWWSDEPMVYLARRIAPNTAAPTDPGYDPNEQKRTQVVFGDWTPKNLDPHEENVEVYSNCEEVELFLNGKSLGSKSKPLNDSPRNWHVTFEPGTIKAVCRSADNSPPAGGGVAEGRGGGSVRSGAAGGTPLPTYELRTAGKAAKIMLSVDKSKITSDWNDVVFLTATVTDANGVPVPDADNMINFEATGAGFIAAVDSADNTDHDPFQAKQRKAYQGRCLAYIKTDKASGKITVTASAPGLKSNTVTITVTK
ncbi:MAG TPA: glycoside hydrolase family 2 TIM barrel-domain containing protein [Pyrinomonadaceae bacterium]|nr:glycoside hydrolase family 2 TIM barrel-domain containing protein [Pyrinomonadaceae bacterium]